MKTQKDFGLESILLELDFSVSTIKADSVRTSLRASIDENQSTKVISPF